MRNKKKFIGYLLCGVVLLLIVIGGILFKNNTKVSDKSEDSGSEEKEVSFFDRDEEAIKKHLASYPNDIDSLKESEALVMYTPYVSGQEYWELFVDTTKKGKKCSIDIIAFDTNDKAIITYLEYNGTDYYQLTDYSRTPSSGYQSSTYSYLNYLEMPEDEDLPDVDKKLVVLSDKKFDLYEDYMEYFESSSYDENDITFILNLKSKE